MEKNRYNNFFNNIKFRINNNKLLFLYNKFNLIKNNYYFYKIN